MHRPLPGIATPALHLCVNLSVSHALAIQYNSLLHNTGTATLSLWHLQLRLYPCNAPDHMHHTQTQHGRQPHMHGNGHDRTDSLQRGA